MHCLALTSSLIAVLVACGEKGRTPSPASGAPMATEAKPPSPGGLTGSAATPTKTPATKTPAAGVPGDANPSPAGAIRATASIQGSVRFAGGAPPRAPRIEMSSDETCEAVHENPVTTETVVVNANGTLRNVFVYVREGIQGDWPAPPEPVVLAQRGCIYHPHVFGIQVGQELRIRNEDETLHNVHALPEENDGFNFGQPKKGDEASKTFDYEEVMILFKCDVHNWMNAWGGVLTHPFYSVTGDEGTFLLEGLPAGTYVIEAWHERYGTREQTVTIEDGEARTLDFAMGS